MRTQFVLSYQTKDGVWHRNYAADSIEEVRLFYRDFNADLRAKFQWKLEREEITRFPLEEFTFELVTNDVTGEPLGYVKEE